MFSEGACVDGEGTLTFIFVLDSGKVCGLLGMLGSRKFVFVRIRAHPYDGRVRRAAMRVARRKAGGHRGGSGKFGRCASEALSV